MKLKKYLKFRYLIVILLGINNVYANGLSTATFTKQLLAYHPFFKQQILANSLAKNTIYGTLAKQDWEFSLTGQYTYQDLNNITNSATNSYNDSRNIALNSSLSRDIYDTGGNINLSYSGSENTTSNTNYSNNIAVNYTHPLWRNKDGLNDKLPYDLAIINKEITTIDTTNNKQNFILEKLKLFVDLTYLQNLVKINNQRLFLTKKELKLVKDKFKVSLAEKLDVLLQEDALLRSEQNLQEVKQSLHALQESLAITLGISRDKIISAMNLYKIHKLDTVIDTNFLVNNNYKLRILSLNKEKINRQLLSNKDINKANLDLSLGIGLISEQKSFKDSLTKYNPNTTIGLNLSYPLGNLVNNNEFDKLILDLENIDYLYQENVTNIKEQTQSLMVKLKYLITIINTNKRQLTIAKQRTEEEESRYKNGVGNTTFVIQAQDNEENINLLYAKNFADYQKYFLEYLTFINKIYK